MIIDEGEIQLHSNPAPQLGPFEADAWSSKPAPLRCFSLGSAHLLWLKLYQLILFFRVFRTLTGTMFFVVQ
jgi:hypothetical protein